MFYKIEEVPKWNPTLLESRIIRVSKTCQPYKLYYFLLMEYFVLQKLDPHTDITYQATIGGGGGVVKSRDFVNLRCWQLIRDGRIVEDYILNPPKSTITATITPAKPNRDLSAKVFKKSLSEDKLIVQSAKSIENQRSLSKSLGAKQFFEPGNSSSEDDGVTTANRIVESGDNESDGSGGGGRDEQDDPFLDAEDKESVPVPKNPDLFISSAISIQYPSAPAESSKYIR